MGWSFVPGSGDHFWPYADASKVAAARALLDKIQANPLAGTQSSLDPQAGATEARIVKALEAYPAGTDYVACCEVPGGKGRPVPLIVVWYRVFAQPHRGARHALILVLCVPPGVA